MSELVDRLREQAMLRYHSRHPFHRAMHDGLLTRRQLAGWVENRYYYQTRIPLKDALIVAKSEDPAFRRAWLRRIVDHDGTVDGEGGLAQWLRLAEGVGLAREDVRSCARVLPGVRAACDRYVAFVAGAPLVEAVASSLTELFAPDLMAARIAAWERHYPWVDHEALAYFRDGDEGLAFVQAHARDRATQDGCIAAFRFKCELLWDLLDAIAFAYGADG